jgi:hypothetical protein
MSRQQEYRHARGMHPYNKSCDGSIQSQIAFAFHSSWVRLRCVAYSGKTPHEFGSVREYDIFGRIQSASTIADIHRWRTASTSAPPSESSFRIISIAPERSSRELFRPPLGRMKAICREPRRYTMY